jgi:hypothetical protein
MEFKIKDMDKIASTLSLTEVNAELQAHKAVVLRVTKRVLQIKIEANIMALQCRRSELMRASFPRGA